MTRVTQLIHDAGKCLLISVYPLPTHPTHNFTHTNGGNLETLPGWPKKLQHNRPARSAGQWTCQAWLLLPSTHWGWVTHICVSRLTIIGSDNGLSPDWRQAIIWTNAWIMLIGPLGTNFSEILIEIQIILFQRCIWKCHLENGGLNVLITSGYHYKMMV